MGDHKQRFVLYMCFETNLEDETCRSLAIVSDQAEATKWKKDKNNNSTDGKKAPDDEKPESNTTEEKFEKSHKIPLLNRPNL